MNLFGEEKNRVQKNTNRAGGASTIGMIFAAMIVCVFTGSELRADSKISSQDRQEADHSPVVVREGKRSLKWHLKAGLGVNWMFVRHESFDVLNSDDVLFTARVDVSGELLIWKGFVAGLAGSFYGTDIKDGLFEEIDVESNLAGFALMPYAGYVFWDVLFPFVSGGFTGSWLRVDLSEDADRMSNRKFAPGFAVSAGLEAYLPRRLLTPLITAGIRMEAGYRDLGDFRFASKEDSDSFVRKMQPALGTVSLRGASLGLILFVSF